MRISLAVFLVITAGILFGLLMGSPVYISGTSPEVTPLAARVNILSPVTKVEEVSATLSVARLYGLSRDQAIILLAIRDHEAGRPGKEFGVELARAQAFVDGRCSLLVQAAHAAKIVAQFCPDGKPETLRAFNHGFPGFEGYAEDPDWWWQVLRKAKRYKNIEY